MHIVLLGDSIFDNAPYVNSGHTVSDHLKKTAVEAANMAASSKDHTDIKQSTNGSQKPQMTLLAIDGDITTGVKSQLTRLPSTATHLFVSCGGNDALMSIPVLDEKVSNVAEALELLDMVTSTFRENYRAMLNSLMARKLDLTVCTIYNCVPGLPVAQINALALFNEIILEEAIRMSLPIIDLRILCDSPEDYSSVSPIEPSSEGGRKIAKLILSIASGDRCDQGRNIHC